MEELERAFDALKKTFPGYENRPQQLEMAGAVLASLRDKRRLLVEAGTGVGKSFAYLIPAILSREKTVVSTASIALQDQLVNKDLVFLQKALPHEFSFAILKGKNNYLCVKREREFSGIGDADKRFREWAAETTTGDKDELSFMPDFWARVCGDSDDCNSTRCPFYGECFYYRHYRSLYRKDILVVNHHLLAYDLISEFNLIPFHAQLIIDEAHQIENTVSHVFGTTLSHSRVMWLLYRLRGLKIAVDHVVEPADRFFRMANVPSQALCPIPEAVIEGLKNLKVLLSFDKVIRRLNSQWETAVDDEQRDKIQTTVTSVKSLGATLDDFIDQTDGDRVYYLTGAKGLIELKSNMVESRGPFNDLTKGYESVIMTSATLTAGGDFRFIKERLGIPRITGENHGGAVFEEMVVGSPFDYGKQSLLYIDRDLPEPDIGRNETVWDAGLMVIERLINASKGRALVLFTSYRHLDFVKKRIRTDFPFKAQGDMPSGKLITWFQKTPNSVLLATTTFWQGIDVKGEKLSLVVITKMPFGSPGDPIYDERCRRLGDRWFNDLALPSAILMVRQGFGRLIRGSGDYGVVAILDTRLSTRAYGKSVLSSLPRMTMTHSVDDVKAFFASVPQPKDEESPEDGETLRNRKRNSDDTGTDRISQVTALGDSDDPSAIPELMVFTKSGNGNERRLAASALGKLARFRPHIYESVEALEGLLSDAKPQVRQYAMRALGKIGKIEQGRLESIVHDPSEKEYNISLARRLLQQGENTRK